MKLNQNTDFKSRHNVSELLAYIPVDDIDYYRFEIRGEIVTHYVNNKSMTPTLELLKKYNPNNLPVYLIDTSNKIIYLCEWWNKTTGASVNYTGKIDYKVDNKKNKLQVHAHYKYEAYQAVGGVRISTLVGPGYLRGHKMIPYDVYGYDIYEFCTLTNTFLGYKGKKEDKAREWENLNKRHTY